MEGVRAENLVYGPDAPRSAAILDGPGAKADMPLVLPASRLRRQAYLLGEDSEFIAAHQTFFDLVGLPRNGRDQPGHLHDVGRVGQLVSLNDKVLAGVGPLNRESAMHHLHVVAQQSHRVLLGRRPAL